MDRNRGWLYDSKEVVPGNRSKVDFITLLNKRVHFACLAVLQNEPFRQNPKQQITGFFMFNKSRKANPFCFSFSFVAYIRKYH